MVTELPPFTVPFMSDGFTSRWLGRMEFEQRVIGELVLPTGRLVLCDALTDPQAGPLARIVEAGTFPAHVSIARLEGGDERIAAAMLRFSEGTIDEWELAMAPNAVPLEAEETHFVGYPVESGTGSFLSAESASLLAARLESEPDFHERIAEALRARYRDTRDWADVPIDEATGVNALLFSAGLGDGVYPSFWGLTSERRPVCLITDFGLVDYHGPEPERG
jgi:hypothetical protein